MAVNAPRVRIASIAENRRPWCDEIRVLFASLRILGGSLATAPAIAYFVSSVSRETAAFLADLDVDVRVVEPMHPEVPKTNVLRLYEEPEAYDWLVSLDPDVVVVRDFAEHLTGTALCGRQADGTPLTLEEWRSMFGHFGLQLPTRRHVTICSGETTIPYPNSGVLFVPGRYVESLRNTWLEFAAAIARDRNLLPATLHERHRWNKNQLSLALTLHRTGIPFRELPVALNFPRKRVHPRLEPDTIEPLLLHHYHALFPDFALKPFWHSRSADSAVRRVNRALAPTFGRRRVTRADVGKRLRRKLRLALRASNEKLGPASR